MFAAATKQKKSRKSNVFHTSRPECIQSKQTFAVGVSLNGFRNRLFKPDIIQVSEAACQTWLINHTRADLFISGSCSLYCTVFSCHGVVPATLSLPSDADSHRKTDPFIPHLPPVTQHLLTALPTIPICQHRPRYLVADTCLLQLCSCISAAGGKAERS